MSSKSNTLNQPYSLKTRWLMQRNRIFGSERFHYWAARLPLFRQVTQRKAAQQMDMITGFVYSQILFVFVETGLLQYISASPRSTAELLAFLDLNEDAAMRVVKAGAAINVLESPQPDLWLLGEMGATLVANPGAMAMIQHHQLLYSDLANPMDMLKRQRGTETSLSQFWHYAAHDAQIHGKEIGGAANSEKNEKSNKGGAYSALMAATQPMIWDQIIGRYPFHQHDKMLDIGGGSGAFASAIGTRNPNLSLGIFDLPEVIPHTRANLTDSPLTSRLTLHPGSFKTDNIPNGYDLITLIRILHDHDDDVAQSLLSKTFDALPKGGKLLIVEPMAETPSAKKMGDAYFGMYLWVMGTGRPRSAQEYHKRLKTIGFSSIKDVNTPLPIIAKAILATK